MDYENVELQKILRSIDDLSISNPNPIDELNYGELIYLHFILESHNSYGITKLSQENFQYELEEKIIGGLITKNYLIHFHPNQSKLKKYIFENSSSFNKVQNDFFELLSKITEGQVLINKHQINYQDFKNLVFIKLQNYKSFEIEDIKGLELIIRIYLREKGLVIVKKYINSYGFWVKVTASLENKIDEILWSTSLLKFDTLIKRVARSVSADMRKNQEINKYLQKYFSNQLNYSYNLIKKIDNPKNIHLDLVQSPVDIFLENIIKRNLEELNELSGSEIINLWLKNPKIEMRFQAIS